MTVLLRYLAKEITLAALLVLAALLALFALFDLIGELGDLGKGGYTLPRMLLFVALSLPAHIYVLFPVAALIGTLFAVSRMAMQSEVAVMRTSGMSLSRLAGFTALLGAAFAVLVFAFGEYVVPYAEELARRIKLQATSSVVAQEFRTGFWIKDDRSFVNIQTVTADTTLQDVRIYEFDAAYRLTSISLAKEGRFTELGNWQLLDVQRTVFGPAGSKVERLPQVAWKSMLSPDLLGALKVKPDKMSIANLSAYIDHLRENRQKSSRYELALWAKAVRPLAVIIMMLLALPFALPGARSGGIGARIVIGISLGIGFHFLGQLLGHLALLNNWSPALTSVGPIVVFLCAAAAMLAFLERPFALRRLAGS